MVAVIDDQDRVLYCRRLTNDLPLIIAALAPFHEDLQGIVLESTYNWYGLSMAWWPLALPCILPTHLPSSSTRD
ncbi:hypothetical protein [Paraburkholderia sp. RAU2J]|uniref:hypothetical protein n=1 Tax=Paraburkholderia sp. RAU2J TaxID=1938810 RepID=UPI001F541FF2|nr:hypothetical protein [Paraburkholderia sp. RAU2J]